MTCILNVVNLNTSFSAETSSVLVALKHAVEDLQRGRCEAAIVGGSNLCIDPKKHLIYDRVHGILSKTGVCRPFDEQGKKDRAL